MAGYLTSEALDLRVVLQAKTRSLFIHNTELLGVKQPIIMNEVGVTSLKSSKDLSKHSYRTRFSP